jgi:hypothetical protein
MYSSTANVDKNLQRKGTAVGSSTWIVKPSCNVSAVAVNEPIVALAPDVIVIN